MSSGSTGHLQSRDDQPVAEISVHGAPEPHGLDWYRKYPTMCPANDAKVAIAHQLTSSGWVTTSPRAGHRLGRSHSSAVLITYVT